MPLNSTTMTTLTTILRIRDSSSDTGLYGYIPTEWICILFIALFGFSTSKWVMNSGPTVSHNPTLFLSRSHSPDSSALLSAMVSIVHRSYCWYWRGNRVVRSTLVQSEPEITRPLPHAVSTTCMSGALQPLLIDAGLPQQSLLRHH